MKRAVIVFVEVAVLILILRSSFAQYLLTDIQETVSNWLTDIAMMEERRVLADLNKMIAPEVKNLNYYQQDYIKDITSSKEQLQHFYDLYCIEKDKNPYIYGVTLDFICDGIQRSKALQLS